MSVLMLVAGLAAATWTDVRSHRIPNAVCAVLMFAGVLAAAATAGWRGAAGSVGGALVGLLAFLPFYLRRGMAAGDVKLMAAAGAWFSPLGALLAAALSLVAGGLLAVSWLVLSSWSSAQPLPGGVVLPQAGAKTRFPYAAAIAAGAIAAAALDGRLSALIPR